MRLSSVRRIWPLVGALIGALAVTSVSGAGHDATNVFHLGLTNTSTATTTLQQGTTSVSLFVRNTNASSGDAFLADSTASAGVYGKHSGTAGIRPGVYGESSSSTPGASAVYGTFSTPAHASDAAAVRGEIPFEMVPTNTDGYGVWGSHPQGGIGVRGTSVTGTGTVGLHQGTTGTEPGVRGVTSSTAALATAVSGALPENAGSQAAAVRGDAAGTNATTMGVYGQHLGSGYGVVGYSGGGNGVWGRTISTTGAAGVFGWHSASSGTGPGVRGLTNSNADLAAGVYGEAPNGSLTAGVFGSSSAFGVLGIGAAAGVLGYNPPGLAGYFVGNVAVTGTLTKGAGAFRIDHPLEPETKYLQHSFVESPDMKNVYDGVIRTDKRGFATVRLPRYFSALNRDFRYQLTIVGRSFAQAIVWKEIAANRFTIKTDQPRIKVSWQVTGIRKDPYANAHRIQTEVAKTDVDHAALRPARLSARLRAK